MLRHAMKRAAFAAILVIGAATAVSPTMAAYFDDEDGPGYAAPNGPSYAPGYGAPYGPGYGYDYYRGQPCVTDESGGRFYPCNYGGGSGH